MLFFSLVKKMVLDFWAFLIGSSSPRIFNSFKRTVREQVLSKLIKSPYLQKQPLKDAVWNSCFRPGKIVGIQH